MNSREKILKGAEQCFFQFGFSQSSISSISKHCGVSRVTIHKYFESKEHLYKEVIATFLERFKKFTEDYLSSSEPFWVCTLSYTKKICGDFLENKVSPIIRSELSHCVHLYCEDEVEGHLKSIVEAIEVRVNRAIESNEIDITKTGLDAFAFSKVLVNTACGISKVEEDFDQPINNAFSIFEVATKK